MLYLTKIYLQKLYSQVWAQKTTIFGGNGDTPNTGIILAIFSAIFFPKEILKITLALAFLGFWKRGNHKGMMLLQYDILYRKKKEFKVLKRITTFSKEILVSNLKEIKKESKKRKWFGL